MTIILFHSFLAARFAFKLHVIVAYVYFNYAQMIRVFRYRLRKQMTTDALLGIVNHRISIGSYDLQKSGILDGWGFCPSLFVVAVLLLNCHTSYNTLNKMWLVCIWSSLLYRFISLHL